MDTADILSQLEEERDRIDQALTALRGARKRPGPKPGVRRMSAEARRRISLAQKRRWAAQKKK